MEILMIEFKERKNKLKHFWVIILIKLNYLKMIIINKRNYPWKKKYQYSK